MTILQFVLLVFLIFALSRVILRFRGGQITGPVFLFWIVVFLLAFFGISFPEETTKLARWLGIGRGVDLIIYVSIAVLFYLVFRAYVLMEDQRHELTELIRKMALEKFLKKVK